MRLRTMLCAALGGSMAAACLAAPSSALALPYDNTDPASGCSSNAYTLLSAPVTSEDDGSVMGTVELRWSRTCNTGWARFTPNPASIQPTLAAVETFRPADSALTSRWAGRYNTDWPVYANQLNGSGSCLVARADFNYDGPMAGENASGATACGGGAQPAGSYAETTGGQVSTWTNYLTAGGTAGPKIAGASATVYVACRVQGFAVANGNTWWYRIASAPWNSSYYASADAFYNNGQISGSLAGTPYVDTNVPLC